MLVPGCTSTVTLPDCGSLITTAVYVIISNENGLDATTYVEPNITRWLTAIGISDINVLKGGLTVYVTHTPAPIPRPIAPVFFPKLQQLEGIIVQECQDCSMDPYIGPTVPMLTGLPGLSQIFRFSQFANNSHYLILTGTAFKDFTSFSGLSCPFSFLVAEGNAALGSFDGLQGVPSGSNFLYLNATGSGPFLSPTSLDGLKPMLGCGGTPTPATLTIPIGCNGTITNVAQACAYQGSSPCRSATHILPTALAVVLYSSISTSCDGQFCYKETLPDISEGTD
jgi:hypothetical protein